VALKSRLDQEWDEFLRRPQEVQEESKRSFRKSQKRLWRQFFVEEEEHLKQHVSRTLNRMQQRGSTNSRYITEVETHGNNRLRYLAESMLPMLDRTASFLKKSVEEQVTEWTGFWKTQENAWETHRLWEQSRLETHLEKLENVLGK
jgi:hypothetical protein